MKNYLKPKRQHHLMTDVINDQAFGWNKYFKLFLLVVNVLAIFPTDQKVYQASCLKFPEML